MLVHYIVALTLVMAASAGFASSEGSPLALSPSPYLRSHADNPVNWLPWSDEAFALARAQNKPIFLSIGYFACYWCHVMEDESFMNADIAAQLNNDFISVKVDREERPDIDRLYLSAVEASGKSGGWPMSLFLLPDGRPFYADTYLAPDKFSRLLGSVGVAWKSKRQAIHQQADSLGKLMGLQSARSESGAELSRLTAENTARAILSEADTERGGFGSAGKFPLPSYLQLLLQDQKPASLDFTKVSLDAMALGAIHDQVGGGFHRYTTDPGWNVPHFEKMLFDQGQLLQLYAQGFARWKSPLYRWVIENTADFLARDMRRADGLWYASMDAQSESQEGAYYFWTPDQLAAALDRAQLDLIRSAWMLTGPAQAKTLRWAETPEAIASALNIDSQVLFERLSGARQSLMISRATRAAPRTDQKIIVAWNAMVIRGLIESGTALAHQAWIDRAEVAARALIQKLRNHQGLHHMMVEERLVHPAFLDDYAALILALVELSKVRDQAYWQSQAIAVSDEMIQRLWDAEKGRFRDTQIEDAHLPTASGGARGDQDTPAGNSLAVHAISALISAGHKRYTPYLKKCLLSFSSEMATQPLAWSDMSRTLFDPAVIALLGPPVSASSSASKVNLAIESGAVVLEVAPNWHIQANPASMPQLIPTRIDVYRDDRVLASAISYPAAKTLETHAGDTIHVYSGRVRIPIPDLGDSDRIEATVQACNDKGVCLAPATLEQKLNP